MVEYLNRTHLNTIYKSGEINKNGTLVSRAINGKIGEWTAIKIPEGFKVSISDGEVISERPDTTAARIIQEEKISIYKYDATEARIENGWLIYIDKTT